MKCSMCDNAVTYYKYKMCDKHYKQLRRKLMGDDQRQYENLRDNLKSKYGISIEEYMHRLDKQRGVCACCGEYETETDARTKQTKRLQVDHDHVTGEVRGLLCSGCNKALGQLKDDVDRIWQLLVYKRKYLKSQA